MTTPNLNLVTPPTNFTETGQDFDKVDAASFVSVKAWGAAGNDSGDQSGAINAAIAASVEGQAIYFPPGIYRITSPIVCPGNRTLLGHRADNKSTGLKTVLKIASPFTTPYSMAYKNGSTPVSYELAAAIIQEEMVTNTADPGPLIVEMLGIDGGFVRTDNDAPIHGIITSSPRAAVRRCCVRNTTGYNIWNNPMNSDGEFFGNQPECSVRECLLAGAGATAIVDDVATPTPGYETALGTFYYDNYHAGVLTGALDQNGDPPGSYSTDGFCVDNVFYSSGGAHVYLLDGAGWTVRGNHGTVAGSHGILLEGGRSARITGNLVDGFGAVDDVGTVYGIGIVGLAAPASGSAIIGNHVKIRPQGSDNTLYCYGVIRTGGGPALLQFLGNDTYLHPDQDTPICPGLYLEAETGTELAASVVGNSFDGVTGVFALTGADGDLLISQEGNGWQLVTSAPGGGQWPLRTKMWNKTPTAGQNLGWVCTTAGSPGTWKTFGAVDVPWERISSVVALVTDADSVGIGTQSPTSPNKVHVSEGRTSTLGIALTNTDNANSGAHAVVTAQTGGSSAGDPYLKLSISGQHDWVVGADNSASDRFVIGKTSPGSQDALSIDPTSLHFGIGTITTGAATTPDAHRLLDCGYALNSDSGADEYWLYGDVVQSVAATTGVKYGLYARVRGTNASGSVGETVAVTGHVTASTSGGTVTIARAFASQAFVASGATIGTYYALYLTSPTGGGTITNEYGVYQQSGTAINYFGGKVGIKTTQGPDRELEVKTSGSGTPRGIATTQYSGDANEADFALRKARGSEASPTRPLASDYLGKVMFEGYDQGASSWYTGAYVTAQAMENFSAKAGTRIVVAVTPSGSTTPGEALRISDAGNVSIGTSADATRKLEVSGSIALITAGNGYLVKEGTNATMGTAALTITAGVSSVVVNTSKVTANSRIFLTNNALGGTAGALYVSARTAGTSFTITSTNGADTSTVGWLIVEPA